MTTSAPTISSGSGVAISAATVETTVTVAAPTLTTSINLTPATVTASASSIAPALITDVTIDAATVELVVGVLSAQATTIIIDHMLVLDPLQPAITISRHVAARLTIGAERESNLLIGAS